VLSGIERANQNPLCASRKWVLFSRD
jgi:hypothetical protein